MELTEFLLGSVRQRPGMYLTSRSLLFLRIFITGYQIACQNSLGKEQDRFLHKFSDWFIALKGLREGSMWYPVMLEEAGNSEEEALELFFRYLDLFDKETAASS